MLDSDGTWDWKVIIVRCKFLEFSIQHQNKTLIESKRKVAVKWRRFKGKKVRWIVWNSGEQFVHWMHYFNSNSEFNFKVSIQSIHVSHFAVESKRKGKLIVTVQSRHDEVEVDFRMFRV